MSEVFQQILLFAGLLAAAWIAITCCERVDKYFSRRRLRKIVAALQSGKRAVNGYRSPFRIECDAERLSIISLKESAAPAALEWKEVLHIEAFKRDLFAVDLICLRFFSADGRWLEADEEMNGWEHLLEILPFSLAGCRPHKSWFSEVVFPAFETNRTKIFSRV